MPIFNKIIIMGSITRQPTLIQEKGKPDRTHFGIEQTKVTRSEDGNSVTHHAYIDCLAFGQTAITLTKFSRTGQQLFVEGRLDFECWYNNESIKQTKHRIIVETYQFLGAACKCGDACKCAAIEEVAV